MKDRRTDWLTGYFGFNGSVCIDPSCREREEEKRNNRRRKEIV